VKPEPLSAQEKPAAKPKPGLDEGGFQQLLEAAFVLQQHNDEEAPATRVDPAELLCEIMALQKLLQTRALDLQTATSLIAEQLQKVTGATGVAVGLVREGQIEYRAVAGDALKEAGVTLPIDSSLAADCVRQNEVIRYRAGDPRLPTEFRQQTPGRFVIVCPVQQKEQVVGALELHFAQERSFADQDLATLELMASLVTEAVSGASDREWKQALAAERATMLEALERIRPQLERLVTPSEEDSAEESATESQLAAEVICPGCGRHFKEEELFCGTCGTARPAATPSSDSLQSKWAALWHMQQASEHKERMASIEGPAPEIDAPLPDPLRKIAEGLNPDPSSATIEDEGSAGDTAEETSPEVVEPVETAVVAETPWASAQGTRRWLESMHAGPGRLWLIRHWRTSRANIYLGASLVLLFLVLSGWGTRSLQNRPANSRKTPAQPALTLFEKMLVGLGLAEAPPAPVYMGNPNVQVWEDVHTALYYCPGSDLYGKTPGGKLTTQRDAQLDQFESASRKNCE